MVPHDGLNSSAVVKSKKSLAAISLAKSSYKEQSKFAAAEPYKTPNILQYKYLYSPLFVLHYNN